VFCSFDSNLLRMMMDLTPTFNILKPFTSLRLLSVTKMFCYFGTPGFNKNAAAASIRYITQTRNFSASISYCGLNTANPDIMKFLLHSTTLCYSRNICTHDILHLSSKYSKHW
jgi:hypothetical protein